MLLKYTCAVIGDPAAHSISPAIHRAAYAKAGLDWNYQAITVKPAELTDFVSKALLDPAWKALSVTAPHKEAICEFGEPDHVTRLVGAGNTLVLGAEPSVYNTDVPGFVRALAAAGIYSLESAAIVGNGATARSILVAMSGLGLKTCWVLARNRSHSDRLIELGNALGIDILPSPLAEGLANVDLLASTIPAEATEPFAESWTGAAAAVFDAVYHPWPTPLGSNVHPEQPTLTGLDLLAGQAVEQIQLQAGIDTTLEECLAAAKAELARRRSN